MAQRGFKRTLDTLAGVFGTGHAHAFSVKMSGFDAVLYLCAIGPSHRGSTRLGESRRVRGVV